MACFEQNWYRTSAQGRHKRLECRPVKLVTHIQRIPRVFLTSQLVGDLAPCPLYAEWLGDVKYRTYFAFFR